MTGMRGVDKIAKIAKNQIFRSAHEKMQNERSIGIVMIELIARQGA